MGPGVSRGRVADAAWIVAGAAAAALGTILGVRLMTGLVDAGLFGQVSLLLGIVVLMTSVAASPIAQAAIHFYPAAAEQDQLAALATGARRPLHRALSGSVVVLVAGAGVAVALDLADPLDLALVCALLLTDGWRTLRLSVLNAARRHRRYSTWVAADAWLRPLAAAGAVYAFGADVSLVLAAHLAVALLLSAVLGRGPWPGQPSGTAPSAARCGEFERVVREYALPLVPLGLLAWIVNLGDRFVIGGLLGAAEAGIYAAAYGLSSAPLMMIAGTVEQAVRPHYQAAVSAGSIRHADRLLSLWLASVAGGCLIAWLAFVAWHQAIASLLLGPDFRAAAALMPWIALGYMLRAIASVLERVCYGHARTRRVLQIQLGTAITAVVATPVATATFGLRGAVAALIASFAVQLWLSARLAVLSRREVAAMRHAPGVVSA